MLRSLVSRDWLEALPEHVGEKGAGLRHRGERRHGYLNKGSGLARKLAAVRSVKLRLSVPDAVPGRLDLSGNHIVNLQAIPNACLLIRHNPHRTAFARHLHGLSRLQNGINDSIEVLT